MTDFVLDYYDWFKAIHIVAMVAWMAGLFYLPRLYVYHVKAKKGSDLSLTLKVMESRLLRIIMNPAMIVTWVLGINLFIANMEIFVSSGWIHAKILLVVILSAFHMALAKYRKDFAADENMKSEKFFRVMNEVPTILLIVIVILAVVKPF